MNKWKCWTVSPVNPVVGWVGALKVTTNLSLSAPLSLFPPISMAEIKIVDLLGWHWHPGNSWATSVSTVNLNYRGIFTRRSRKKKFLLFPDKTGTRRKYKFALAKKVMCRLLFLFLLLSAMRSTHLMFPTLQTSCVCWQLFGMGGPVSSAKEEAPKSSLQLLFAHLLNFSNGKNWPLINISWELCRRTMHITTFGASNFVSSTDQQKNRTK